ncbi:MAG: DUF554 domain-containing protein [Actinobacteria bacterium]|nr:DUF554 domain-containing protein [Actinomycetota bacterium]
MFIGLGTVVNVITVLVGSGLGVLVGHRLPERTRTLVTTILGLFTLVIGGRAIASGLSEALSAEVGADARLLVVLGALLIGGIIGSLLQLEQRLDGGAQLLHDRFASRTEGSRFVEGAVTSTLVFCVGPLSILGSLSDGLGHGSEQLLIKAVMDGFAAIAFASSFGIGVMASVIPLALYQGLLTLLGFALGNFLPAGHLDALGAAGGVILLGLGIRLAAIKQIPVGDLLPALVVAPLLVAGVGLFR